MVKRLQSFDLLKVGLDEERPSAEEGRHSLVHDAVALHEAEAGLGQGGRVERTPPRSRVRFLDLGHWQPVGVGRLLLLEGPFEGVHEVPDPECADGVASDGVPGRGEDGVDQPRGLTPVITFNDLTGGLCKSIHQIFLEKLTASISSYKSKKIWVGRSQVRN